MLYERRHNQPCLGMPVSHYNILNTLQTCFKKEDSIPVCHIGALYDNRNEGKDITTSIFIDNVIPFIEGFKHIMALSLVNHRLATCVGEYLHANYKKLLEPMCEELNEYETDDMIEALSQVVLPMRQFVFKGYADFVLHSIDVRSLLNILTRLCYLATSHEEDMYQYMIPQSVIDVCVPNIHQLPRSHARSPDALINDIMNLLWFMNKDVISEYFQVTHLNKWDMAAPMNEIYLYPGDYLDSNNEMPYAYPIEHDKWIDIRLLKPIITNEHRLIQGEGTLLRVLVPKHLAAHGPTIYISGERLLSIWCMNIETLYTFKCLMK